MATTIRHQFVSAKAAPTDPTKVGGPNWNDDHVFGGGSAGALAWYDTTASPTNLNWIPAVAVGSVLVSGGVGAVPVWSDTPSLTSLALSTPLPVTSGGLGLSACAAGDLFYGSAANTAARLADVATGSVLVSGGVGVAPTWSATPTLTDLTLTGVLKGANGSAAAPSYSFASQTTTGRYKRADGSMTDTLAGTPTLDIIRSGPNIGYTLSSDAWFGWSDTSDATHGHDLTLFRDAANTLAQRNGTNAQVFNIYNTYTDGSNYERGFVAWQGNNFVIGTTQAGTGTKRNLVVSTNGSNRWYLPDFDGHIKAYLDNTYDIGASGANRPRTGYFGTSLVAPVFKTTTALITAVDGGSTAAFTANMVGSTGGPTTAAQNGWLKMQDSTGATVWVPVWK